VTQSLARRWQSLRTEHGSANVAVLYLLHRVLQLLSRGRAAVVPYLLVAQPVGNAVLAEVKSDPGTVVRRIGPDDPVTAEFPRPREVVAARFAAGAECHVAFVKERFAGFIWIMRTRYVEDEVRCTYEIANPAAGVWDFDVYVEPRLRLGRTMARLWKAVDETLTTEGVHWSFSRINRFNTASVRSHQRLGARSIGSAVFLVFGPLQLALGGGMRLPSVSLGPVVGPQLRVQAPLPPGP
jgi:hypothetical protein